MARSGYVRFDPRKWSFYGNPDHSNMTLNITQLPVETLERILSFVSYDDRFTIALTCRLFRNIVKGNTRRVDKLRQETLVNDYLPFRYVCLPWEPREDEIYLSTNPNIHYRRWLEVAGSRTDLAMLEGKQEDNEGWFDYVLTIFQGRSESFVRFVEERYRNMLIDLQEGRPQNMQIFKVVLGCLEWLWTKKPYRYSSTWYDVRASRRLLENRDHPLLTGFLVRNFGRMSFSGRHLNYIAKEGDLEYLIRFHTYGYGMTLGAATTLYRHGHVRCLRYCLEFLGAKVHDASYGSIVERIKNIMLTDTKSHECQQILQDFIDVHTNAFSVEDIVMKRKRQYENDENDCIIIE